MSMLWGATSVHASIEEKLFRPGLQECEAISVMDEAIEGIDEEAELDKQWSAVHFLLTGKVEPFNSPLSWAIFGERRVAPNLGYGGDYVSARATAKIARAFQDYSLERLLSEYTPEQLVEQYECSAAASDWGYQIPNFPWVRILMAGLRDFYDFAASLRRGVYIQW